MKSAGGMISSIYSKSPSVKLSLFGQSSAKARLARLVPEGASLDGLVGPMCCEILDYTSLDALEPHLGMRGELPIGVSNSPLAATSVSLHPRVRLCLSFPRILKISTPATVASAPQSGVAVVDAMYLLSSFRKSTLIVGARRFVEMCNTRIEPIFAFPVVFDAFLFTDLQTEKKRFTLPKPWQMTPCAGQG